MSSFQPYPDDANILTRIVSKPPEMPEDFWRQINSIMARRMRLACLFGLLFRPALYLGLLLGRGAGFGIVTDPVDVGTLAAEVSLGALFLVGFLGFGLRGAPRYVPLFAFIGFPVVSLIICWPLATLDPLHPDYYVLVLRNTIVILAAGLFLPWPGRWILLLGAMPLGIQLVLSAFGPLGPQIPIHLSSAASLFVAASGGQMSFEVLAAAYSSTRSTVDLVARQRQYLKVMLDKISTPMRDAIALSESIQMDTPPEKVRQSAWRVEKDARDAHAAIRNVLAVSVLEARIGEPEGSGSRTDVSRAVPDALDEWVAEARLRRILLTSDPVQNVAAAIDPRDFGWLMTNLLDFVFRHVDDGGDIRVRVRSHGGGIHVEATASPAEDLVARSSTLLLEEGVSAPWEHGEKGVGLYVIREIVRKWGGRVSIWGGGTTTVRVVLSSTGEEAAA